MAVPVADEEVVRVDATRAAQVIREARAMAGLTQAELAARAGLTRESLVRYEGGQVQPSVERLCRIVRAAGHELRFRLEPHSRS